MITLNFRWKNQPGFTNSQVFVVREGLLIVGNWWPDEQLTERSRGVLETHTLKWTIKNEPKKGKIKGEEGKGMIKLTLVKDYLVNVKYEPSP